MLHLSHKRMIWHCLQCIFKCWIEFTGGRIDSGHSLSTIIRPLLLAEMDWNEQQVLVTLYSLPYCFNIPLVFSCHFHTLPREGEDLITSCCLVTGVKLGSSSMIVVVYYLLRRDRRFGPVYFRELQRCLRLDRFRQLLHTELCTWRKGSENNEAREKKLDSYI